MIGRSFGNAIRLTGDAAGKDVMLTVAASLAKRYSPPRMQCAASTDGAGSSPSSSTAG